MRFQNMQMVDLVRPVGEAARIRQRHLHGAPRAGCPLRAGQYHAERHAPELRRCAWTTGRRANIVDDVARDTSSALVVSPGPPRSSTSTTRFRSSADASRRGSARASASRTRSRTTSRSSSPTATSPNSRGRSSSTRKLDRTSVRSSLPVGNPDLNPETTVAYELGIRNQLSGNDVLTVTAYYKDIFDYITEKTVQRLGTHGRRAVLHDLSEFRLRPRPRHRGGV